MEMIGIVCLVAKLALAEVNSKSMSISDIIWRVILLHTECIYTERIEH